MGMGRARVKAQAGAGAARRPRYIARVLGTQPATDRITPRGPCEMYAVLNLFNTVISIYIWLLIASVVLSWLIAFNVINTGNRFVYDIRDFLGRITEPLLRPIR